ncbi:MAG: hypothetical protein MJB14_06135 [Spirochaetes bacterium]|nr:hypothetical protein [Spirochaetota bacterium]
MIYLVIITASIVLLSFMKDRNKTIKGLQIAYKKFLNILAPLVGMLILVSIALFFITEELITRYLSNGDQSISVLIASILGSITLMPGFIAFPLSGILRQNGVTYMVISAFTSTLMMVGIITFPIEKNYLGIHAALMRNVIAFLIALAVALMTGILFGEVF